MKIYILVIKELYLVQRKNSEALSYLLKVNTSEYKENDPRIRALKLHLGICYEELDLDDQAIIEYIEADKEGEVSLINLARKKKGLFDSIKVALLSRIEKMRKQGRSKVQILELYKRLALVAENSERSSDALSFYKICLKFAIKIGDEDSDDEDSDGEILDEEDEKKNEMESSKKYRTISMFCLKIFELLKNEHKYSEAAKYLLRYIQNVINQPDTDYKDIASRYESLAELYELQDKKTEAQLYQSKASSLLKVLEETEKL